MDIDKNIRKLISILEIHVGTKCWNPNSTNGHTGKVGQYIRYPVYAKINGKQHKTQGRYRMPEEFDVYSMHYKFGSNHLYIGDALADVLDILEIRYDLDFSELEDRYQSDKNKLFKLVKYYAHDHKWDSFEECKKERDRLIRSVRRYEKGKNTDSDYTEKKYRLELMCLSRISEIMALKHLEDNK